MLILRLFLLYPRLFLFILKVAFIFMIILGTTAVICKIAGIPLPPLITNRVSTYMASKGLPMKDIMFNLSGYEKEVLRNTINPEDIDETFDNIGGNENVISLIKQLLIEPLSNKEKYIGKKLLKPPNGIILYGPPGTGKTMIARAVAAEMGGSFISVSPDFVENKFFGESQKTIKAIFSLADKMKPSVIFIDEIDGLLSKRSSFDQSHVNSCKTQFLSMMDGINKRDENVIVIGATNALNQIDPAVLRRMRLQLQVDLPCIEDRTEIMKKIIPMDEVCEDIDISALAEAAEGFSGSDLNEMCKLAAQFAMRNGNDVISQSDFLEAQEALLS